MIYTGNRSITESQIRMDVLEASIHGRPSLQSLAHEQQTFIQETYVSDTYSTWSGKTGIPSVKYGEEQDRNSLTIKAKRENEVNSTILL